MTPAEKKKGVTQFYSQIDEPDAAAFGRMVTDNFKWYLMILDPDALGMPSSLICDGKAGLQDTVDRLKLAFPNGLHMTYGPIICEGDEVAMQCKSDTVIANGRKYSNVYHVYVRFEGDKIAEIREYADMNRAREKFMM